MRVKSDKVQAPMSAAGLVRYFDISGGGVSVPPEYIAIVAAVFIVAEIIAWFVL
ncbi:MAG: preprotein translocase subunit Sec61beta [Candidatus Diapherotrites archaeon]|nr:preprotein translocase subunit Sec61beta [Candidatus Diapherotrites archaeon]